MTALNNSTILLSVLCLLYACGDDTVVGPDAGHLVSNCGLDELTPNVTGAENNELRVIIVAASPLPAEIYLNDWQVKITDLAGNPVTNQQDFVMKADMPEHGHGTKHDPVISETDVPGVFKIDDINLWMEGIWEVSFRRPEQTGTDTAIIQVCIPKT